MITNNITKAFPDNNSVSACSNYYSERITAWNEIYCGRPQWLKIKKAGLSNRGTRIMSQLNTAKVLCDYLSDLTFSEQCDVTVSDSEYQNFLDQTLNRCGFWKFLPEFISKAYALGGGTLKVYADNNEICIDYVKALDFAPAAWVTNDIKAGAFQTVTHKGDWYYTLIELQSGNKIVHRLFKSKAESDLGDPCTLSEVYPDIADVITFKNISRPLFSYFRPNVSNNIPDTELPLGVSVFANAVDTLKALDIAFDSFSREFVLGKKRIIVPAESIQTVVNPETGKTEHYYDADDEAFVALKTEDTDGLKIIDNTVELRVEEHVSAINALLNILCLQVGISAGSLSFDAAQGMKTATEVVSQESKTQRTVRGNKNILTETVEAVVRSIFELAIALGKLPKREYEITVGWQDNVVIDDNTLIDNTIKLYSAGLIDIATAVMRVNKCDEKTAAEIVDKIHSASAMGSADFFGAQKPDEKQEE